MVEDKKPADDADKNSEALEATRDEQGKFKVEESKPEVKAEVEPKPQPKPEAKVEVKSEAPKANAATTAKVEISKAALVYSDRKRNSVSVGVLQDILAELGYADARSDFRGWFHDGTKSSIEKWQKDNGLEVTGTCESDSDLKSLFDGTGVVVVD